MSSGGAHGIHTKNIFCDLQIEVVVRLETDSTSTSGICRHWCWPTDIFTRKSCGCKTKLQPRTSNWTCAVCDVTEVTIGEDLNKVVFLVTVRVVLFSCARVYLIRTCQLEMYS